MKVCCDIVSYDPSLWVEPAEEQPGVRIVEGPLEHVVKFNEKACRYEGVLHVFVEPNHSLDLSNDDGPWTLRQATHQDRELSRLCAERGETLAVSEFRAGPKTACHLSSRNGERICR